MTDDIFENIVAQTCLYADQYIASHTIGPWSRVKQWPCKPLTIDELWQFFALVIVMGLVSYPSLEDYLLRLLEDYKVSSMHTFTHQNSLAHRFCMKLLRSILLKR